MSKFKIQYLFPLLFLGVSFSQCALFNGEYGKNTSRSTSSSSSNHSSSTKEDRMRKDIVAYAKKHVGARYKYAGRDPRGFDCSGFTYYVLKEFGVTLPTSSKTQANVGEKISVKDAQSGDLIFFKRSPASRVFHVSLIVSNDRNGIQVIHSTSRGVVVDNITESKYWNPKISSVRRVLN
ncbi:MAG: hypothetical protein DHS20C18_39210 [Saprospiraceae bacterium]|nr:MAG: hypothetical protein DHS20C18_39210 [Saprospiraceae bacterium]